MLECELPLFLKGTKNEGAGRQQQKEENEKQERQQWKQITYPYIGIRACKLHALILSFLPRKSK
jgi:hypothetical protein